MNASGDPIDEAPPREYPFQEYPGPFNASTPAPFISANATTTEIITYSEPNMAVVGVLLGLIAVLSICFCAMTVPPLYVYLRKKMPDNPRQVQRRYETIEAWLISKKTRAHSDTCARIRKEYPVGEDDAKHQSLKLSTSYDTAETEGIEHELWEDDEKECPICMETFQEDEIVSWSPNARCEHVFHHECVKEWLLRHANCPYCRNPYLPIDEYKRTLNKLEIKQLAHQRSHRSATTYYCVENGLVTIQRPASKTQCPRSDMQSINALTSSGVKKGELSKLRGSRIDMTNCCDGEEDNAPILESPAVETLPASASLDVSGISSLSLPVETASADSDAGENSTDALPVVETAVDDVELGQEPSESPSIREGEEVTNEAYIATIQAQGQARSLRY